MTVRSVRAFTLVEMLVVVAVLSLLIGILLPSLSAARAQSRNVACRANMATIARLMTAYAIENDGIIPHGPTHDGVIMDDTGQQTNRVQPTIATRQLWLGQSYSGTPWYNPAAPSTEAPPQYLGLGLLTKQPGQRNNAFLFCPADDESKADAYGSNIGQTQSDAFGSYLYRQRDAMSGTTALLERLGSTSVQLLVDPADNSTARATNIEVSALIVDANSDGPRGPNRFSNHQAERVNVTFADGSVLNYENVAQAGLRTDGTVIESAWGSIAEYAFQGSTPGPWIEGLQAEFDRIFLTADVLARNQDPKRIFPLITAPPPN